MFGLLHLIDMSGLFNSPGRSRDTAELKLVLISFLGSNKSDKFVKSPLIWCGSTNLGWSLVMFCLLYLIDMSGLFNSPGRRRDTAELKLVLISFLVSNKSDKLVKSPLIWCGSTNLGWYLVMFCLLYLIDMSGLFNSPGRHREIAGLKLVLVSFLGSNKSDKFVKSPLKWCGLTYLGWSLVMF
jgi:hypothetical protein